MQATALLMEEHELIQKGLRVLEVLAVKAGRGDPVPPEAVKTVLDFLTEFADAHHHEKEEKILFPALEQSGLPREAGPIAVMLYEHDQGREFIRALRETAQPPDAVFARAARAYASLLANHIEKENHVLFRMAESAIDGELRRDVDARMQAFEQEHAPRRRAQQKAIEELAKSLL